MASPETSLSGEFTVTFHGARGTRMVAGDNFNRYARNTICIEINAGGRVIVLDAGSGFVDLGTSLIERGIRHFDLFLTHSHYDHVEGIPFFQPFYMKEFTAGIWSGRLRGIRHTRDIIDRLMIEPFFPISQEKFLANIRYHDIADYETVHLAPGLTVETVRLHHPGGATGYKVRHGGKSFALITDTTHAPNQRDNDLVTFLSGVSAFAYDCSYTDAEFPQYASFGHSTWEEGARLRAAAGARRMIGLHHMPFRTDAQLDRMAAWLKDNDPASSIATDGMVITL